MLTNNTVNLMLPFHIVSAALPDSLPVATPCSLFVLVSYLSFFSPYPCFLGGGVLILASSFSFSFFSHPFFLVLVFSSHPRFLVLVLVFFSLFSSFSLFFLSSFSCPRFFSLPRFPVLVFSRPRLLVLVFLSLHTFNRSLLSSPHDLYDI